MRALTRPRTWLLAAALLATAAPAAAAPAPAPRPDLTRFLLDDTDFVLVVNVKQVLASPAFTKTYQKQVQDLLRGDVVKPWLEGTGFDPLKDVERLIVVMGRSCHPSQDTDEAGPLVFVQGRFDPDKLRAKMDKLAESMPGALQAHTIDGLKAYQLKTPGPSGIGCLLDRRTLLLGPPRKDFIADAAARYAGKKKVELKYKALKPLLDKMSADASVSFVGLGEMVVGSSVSVSNDGMKTTRTVKVHTLGEEGVTSIQGSVTVGAEAKGRATLTAKSDEDAKKLAKGMTDGLGMARAELQRAVEKQPQYAPVLTVLQSVRITGKGRTITLEGHGDAEAVKLFPMLLFGVSRAAPTAPAARP
ncbi:MAG TPA: hypothetical protein VFE78_03035 [Gemmataceae bacterium]|nr:hypothetical protein [Gemmataceae bacterium]